jgi:glucose-6-phosphate isomerase
MPEADDAPEKPKVEVARAVVPPKREATPLVELDFTDALASGLGKGLGFPDESLEGLAERLVELTAGARRDLEAGRLDLLGLPTRRDHVEAVTAWNERRPRAKDVIVVGIGGSALGARLLGGLGPEPHGEPVLHVIDTVDPEAVEGLLQALSPSSSIVVGISKSGTTVETVAVLRLVEDWMHGALGPMAAARIAIVCGEEANPLRTHAAERGYACFAIPAGVGGRYSVLTPAGLLPAAAVGVDLKPLLAGAATGVERALQGSLAANPALALAGLQHLAWESGRRAWVLWSYGERLRPLGPWWVQLVGESLGKLSSAGPVGPTPLAATGPADQHSLLQLLLEGPDDKWTVLVEPGGVEGTGRVVPEDADRLAPVGGTPLGTLLMAECEATAYALARAGRPFARLRLPEVGPQSLGALIVTLEMATVYSGRLLEVNPFDQPAVALGKRALKARLRGDPAALAKEMEARAKRPKRTSA